MLDYDRYRWRQHLFRLQGSVLPAITPRLLTVTAFATLMTLLVKYEKVSALPIAVHTFLGVALGLLLTFRTQTGYERFWEGRKAWGAIVNRSRNLARLFGSVARTQQERDEAFALIIAFGHGARLALRGDGNKDSVIRVLGEERAHAFDLAPGVPQRCLLELDKIVDKMRAEGRIDSVDQSRFDRDLTDLIDQLGACERIKKTPIPIAYVLHMRRFLALYCGTLPLSLVKETGFGTPLVVLFVAYALFGIEQIGVEIEDPFEDATNDIDLGAITTTIENDLRAINALESKP